MPRTLRPLVFAATLTVALAPTGALAFNDPDWPCVQRKVTQLSWGQMWSGPPLPEQAVWRDDPRLSSLVPRLSARRTTLDETASLVGDLEPDADFLTQLFAGVLAQIDDERRRLIAGIGRYAVKQRGLSEQIDARRTEIGRLRAETGEDDFDALDKIEQLEDALAWDTRIYQERQRSLIYVCESPVILEKRAFAVAKIIQARLEGQ